MKYNQKKFNLRRADGEKQVNYGLYFKNRKLIEDGKPVQTADSVRELAEQFYYMMKQGRINFEEEVDAEYNGEPPF